MFGLELSSVTLYIMLDVVSPGGYAEPVYRLGDLIAQIDVIISLAIASSNAPIPYIRPKIYPMGESTCK